MRPRPRRREVSRHQAPTPLPDLLEQVLGNPAIKGGLLLAGGAAAAFVAGKVAGAVLGQQDAAREQAVRARVATAWDTFTSTGNLPTVAEVVGFPTETPTKPSAVPPDAVIKDVEFHVIK